MRAKRNGMIMAAVVAVLMSGFQAGAQKYEADWESLAKHNAEPEWLKDKPLYATALAWPENGKIVVQSLKTGSKLYPGEIGSVAMVGLREPVQWQRTAQGLEITFPAQKPTEWEWAYSFRIR